MPMGRDAQDVEIQSFPDGLQKDHTRRAPQEDAKERYRVERVIHDIQQDSKTSSQEFGTLRTEHILVYTASDLY